MLDDIPDYLHSSKCSELTLPLKEDSEILMYLFPLRRISFDGFISYESRRFGVPYRYIGQAARVRRKNDTLYIYSADLKELLVTHDVTWSKLDSYCRDQFPENTMPEELPSAPVMTRIQKKRQN